MLIQHQNSISKRNYSFVKYFTARTRSAPTRSFSRLELSVDTYSWLNLALANSCRLKLDIADIMPATTRFNQTLVAITRSNPNRFVTLGESCFINSTEPQISHHPPFSKLCHFLVEYINKWVITFYSFHTNRRTKEIPVHVWTHQLALFLFKIVPKKSYV